MSSKLVNEGLAPVDPAYVTVLRIEMVLVSIPFVIGALVGEIANLLFTGAFLVPVVLLAMLLVLMVPLRRYNARGYDMAQDRLRVVRGLLFRKDTVVPFSRVQHIDVLQGPLERAFGIGRLVLHTAGTHNASVLLPGLNYERASEMREEIRAHVKRETM